MEMKKKNVKNVRIGILRIQMKISKLKNGYIC